MTENFRRGTLVTGVIRPESQPPPEAAIYEQGYRDALLTARSALLAAARASNSVNAALVELDALIEDQNQDLWSTMAIVKVLSPEGASLRQQLRAPFGAAIDSEGRMLFLRIPNAKNTMSPLEYDTGVMGLLEENARLKALVAEGPRRVLGPPSAEVVEAALKLTPEQIFQTSVKAGIHHADGTLTPQYRPRSSVGDSILTRVTRTPAKITAIENHTTYVVVTYNGFEIRYCEEEFDVMDSEEEAMRAAGFDVGEGA